MKTMKRWPQYLLVIILALLQIATATLTGPIYGNLLLAYFVAASIFFEYGTLVWLALVGGLILDLYGAPGSFGLNIGFLLLLVMISKLIIRLEDQSQRLWYGLLLSVGFSILFYVAELSFVVNAINSAVVWSLIWRLIGAICYNGLITVVIFTGFEFATNKRSRKLHWR